MSVVLPLLFKEETNSYLILYKDTCNSYTSLSLSLSTHCTTGLKEANSKYLLYICINVFC